jgi:serine/threonine-protein kinase
MSTIFEAEDLHSGRHVAVKVVSPELASRADVRARFRQEADVMAALDHPHVVRVLDFETTERGTPFLVLELLEGETLEDLLGDEGALNPAEAVAIVVQIASALSAIHAAGIVHRDLKPANVFLTRAPDGSPFVKILDFGISKTRRKLTLAGSLLGTPDYMAPEQASGRNDVLDARADQFSLAVIAYEMFTGRQPFADDDQSVVFERLAHLEVPPVSTVATWLPESLNPVLSRALSKDPGARFEGVVEFAREVARATGASAASATLPPTSGVMRRSVEDARTRPTRPSAVHPTCPSADDLGASELSSSFARSIERAASALESRAYVEAAAHADAAMRAIDGATDSATSALLRVSEPLLARIFVCRLGSPTRRVALGSAATEGLPLSPRTAFLLSRLVESLTITEVLEAGWLSRLETLRSLVQLVSCGALRLV